MTDPDSVTDTTTAAPLLAALPDDARVWLYATAAPLSDASADAIATGLGAFFTGWKSHGRTVRGGAEVIGDRLIAVAATVDGGNISGCGIDQHVRVLDTLLADTGAALADALAVVYRDAGGAVHVATRAEARRMREAGAGVAVIRRDVTRLGDLRGALAG